MQPFGVVETDIPVDVLPGFVKVPVFGEPNDFFFQRAEPPLNKGISVWVVVTCPFVDYAAVAQHFDKTFAGHLTAVIRPDGQVLITGAVGESVVKCHIYGLQQDIGGAALGKGPADDLPVKGVNDRK